MDNEKYNRSVTLLCPTCGNSLLETQDSDPEKEIIRCPLCSRSMTKEDLIRENAENIDANLDEVKKEVIKAIRKEFGDMLKKTFRGSKNIRIK